MKVALLNINQKESLTNQKYNDDSFFNPVQDADGNFIISIEEIEQNIYPEFDWIKSLPLIDFKPNE